MVLDSTKLDLTTPPFLSRFASRHLRRGPLVCPLLLFLAFFTLALRTLSPSSKIVLHLVPHSHLDPGWRSTSNDAYHNSALPIYKQTLLELLLDPRRTFTMEPILFLARFHSSAGDSPISANVASWSTPLEMYTSAVTSSLSLRSRSLEPNLLLASSSPPPSSQFAAPAAEELWRWRGVERGDMQKVAAVLREQEGKGEEER